MLDDGKPNKGLPKNEQGRSDKNHEDEGDTPDKIVVSRTKQYMAQHGEKNFSVAQKAILEADPKLAEEYLHMNDA